jgi:surface carbohydrate biosynthesis protein
VFRRFLQRIQFLQPIKTEVLIFDILGSTWLPDCLPPSTSFQFLNLRKGFPLVWGYAFYRSFFKTILISAPRNVAQLRTAYLHSVIELFDPQLVLSLADNNQPLLDYASSKEGRPVVLIQNALRRRTHAPFTYKRIPTYFTLGLVEQRRFAEAGTLSQEIIPLGSLALGIALALPPTSPLPPADICFISSYRPAPHGKISTTESQLLVTTHRILFLLVVEFAATNGFRVRVITKAKTPDQLHLETAYFTELAPKKKIDFVVSDRNLNPFNSYYGAMSSRLIICDHSTLGFELFGIGYRVLFGSSISPELLSMIGIEDYFSELPTLVKLEARSQVAFNSKAQRLLGLRDNEYVKLTTDASTSLVAMPPQSSPQRLIQNTLRPMLLQKNRTN